MQKTRRRRQILKKKKEEKEREDQRRDREERSIGSKWSDRIKVAAILVASGSD